MKQLDRTAQTKQKIVRAFIEILQEIPATEVRVSDITKKAQIDRGSFYRYFENKEALIEDCEESILSKFYIEHEQLLKQVNSLNEIQLVPTIITPLLDTISDNLEMIDTLLNRLGDNHFYVKFKDFLLDEGMATVTKLGNHTGRHSDKQQELLANYTSSAILGLISLWSSDSRFIKQDIETFIGTFVTQNISKLI